MSEISKKFGAPALPSVNLIPSEIAERTKMRMVRITALVAVLIAIGVVLAAYVITLGATQVAKSGLDDAIENLALCVGEERLQRVGGSEVLVEEANRLSEVHALEGLHTHGRRHS